MSFQKYTCDLYGPIRRFVLSTKRNIWVEWMVDYKRLTISFGKK